MEHATHSAHHLALMFSNILLFFGIAGVVVPQLQRLRMSPVLAYLLCGVIIGPFGLAALADRYPWLAAVTIKELGTVQMLGELGIICLMFMIGLELSLGPFTGAADESIGMILLTSLGVGICTVLAMMLLGKRILAPLLRSVSTARNAEWLGAFIVFFVIACAAVQLEFEGAPVLAVFG
jgi:monovalent cation:H+ antiporter-2, CPA2 family